MYNDGLWGISRFPQAYAVPDGTENGDLLYFYPYVDPNGKKVTKLLFDNE